MISTDSKALYDSIAAANEERVYKMWHASSLAICPRSHYFKRLGVPSLQTPTAAKMIRWQAGHLLEEAIREHVANVYGGGEELQSNQRFTSKKLQLTGEFDNLALIDNRLIEIKSVHDFAFKEKDGVVGLKEEVGTRMWGGKEVKTYEVSQNPYLHHEIQNHGYVLLLAENGVEVKEIDYVYISLSGRIVTYTTQVKPELLDRCKARLDMLNRAWEASEPPQCICKPDHPLWGGVLQWCDYRNDGDECCSLNLIKLANKEK